MYLLVTGRCGIDLEQGSVGQARLATNLERAHATPLSLELSTEIVRQHRNSAPDRFR